MLNTLYTHILKQNTNQEVKQITGKSIKQIKQDRARLK